MISSFETKQVAGEVSLLQRIAKGDPDAVSELYDLRSPSLYSIILRIVGNDGAAEDILREVFQHVWEGAISYNAGLFRPSVWLTQIAHDAAIVRLRLKPSEDRWKEGDNASHEYNEQQREITEAMVQLPLKQRTLIEHVYFRGCTQSELAQHFQEPLGTVREQICAGMAMLRIQLLHLDPNGKTTMNSSYLEELAALNALGILDGEDLVEFKRLAPNVTFEAQKEIASYKKVAGMIALVGVQERIPPMEIKRQLMTWIHESVTASIHRDRDNSE